jgi:hypothetical protein
MSAVAAPRTQISGFSYFMGFTSFPSGFVATQLAELLRSWAPTVWRTCLSFRCPLPLWVEKFHFFRQIGSPGFSLGQFFSDMSWVLSFLLLGKAKHELLLTHAASHSMSACKAIEKTLMTSVVVAAAVAGNLVQSLFDLGSETIRDKCRAIILELLGVQDRRQWCLRRVSVVGGISSGLGQSVGILRQLASGEQWNESCENRNHQSYVPMCAHVVLSIA